MGPTSSSQVTTHMVVTHPVNDIIQFVKFHFHPVALPVKPHSGASRPSQGTLSWGGWGCYFDQLDHYSMRKFAVTDPLPSSPFGLFDHFFFSLGKVAGDPDATYVSLHGVGLDEGMISRRQEWPPVDREVMDDIRAPDVVFNGRSPTQRLPYDVHDVALMSPDYVVLAQPTGLQLKQQGQEYVEWTTRRLSCGEPLCIESDEASMPHLAFVGCRSGSTCWVDLRSPTTSAVPCVGGLASPRVPPTLSPFGHVTRLHLLFHHRPGQLLVKSGTTGLCRLYDIRRASSQREPDKDPALVHDFQVPPSLHPRGHTAVRGQAFDGTESFGHNRLATSRCRGMATNPLATMLLNPLVSTDATAGIGYWCLTTGAFVGYHAIDLNDDRSDSAFGDESENPATGTPGTPWMELCPTITPALPRRCEDQKDDPWGHLGMFGLWVSCGRSTGGTSPPGLFQVTCPGVASDFRVESP